MILVDPRRRGHLSLLEWWALVAAFLPVTLGTLLSVWVVRVLLTMSGVGG
jgi:1,4-dihydroxy-2-naphthoate octaprenyltransferase